MTEGLFDDLVTQVSLADGDAPMPEAPAPPDTDYGPGGLFDDLSPPLAAPVAPGEAEEGGFVGGVKLLGEAMTEVPGQVVSSVGAAIRGGDIGTGQEFYDKWIEEGRASSEAFMAEGGVRDEHKVAASLPDFLGGGSISYKDIRELPRNIGFSLTSMLAGMGVGLPIMVAPVPGARPAAWAAGTAASGVAAYRMAKDQFVVDIKDFLNRQSVENRGSEMTDKEWVGVRADYEDAAEEFGLWEAVPEALSNAAGLKIIRAPLKAVMNMPGLRNILSRGAVKFAGIQAMEHGTETVTGVGQARLERAVGLREDVAPDSLFEEAAEVAKAQAAQVTLLTTVLGGGAAIGSKAYDLAAGKPEQDGVPAAEEALPPSPEAGAPTPSGEEAPAPIPTAAPSVEEVNMVLEGRIWNEIDPDERQTIVDDLNAVYPDVSMTDDNAEQVLEDLGYVPAGFEVEEEAEAEEVAPEPEIVPEFPEEEEAAAEPVVPPPHPIVAEPPEEEEITGPPAEVALGLDDDELWRVPIGDAVESARTSGIVVDEATEIDWRAKHRTVVEAAIERGEDVPADVLAEYPDMMAAEDLLEIPDFLKRKTEDETMAGLGPLEPPTEPKIEAVEPTGEEIDVEPPEIETVAKEALPVVEKEVLSVIDYSPDDLDALISEQSGNDRQKLIRALGSEEAAVEFERLERRANSLTNLVAADAASAEMNKITDEFTEEQERLVFGVGEKGLNVEDLKEVRRALEDTVFDENDIDVDVAQEVTQGARRLTVDKVKKVLAGGGIGVEQADVLRMQRGMAKLQARGLDNAQIDELLLEAMGQRGFSRGDAAEILSSFGRKVSSEEAKPQRAIAKPEEDLPVVDTPETVSDAIEDAVTEIDEDPSEAQKESGNYKKGHIQFKGMDITIENARGSTRSGRDADGEEWTIESMPAHYGYIKQTEGADGEHVDIYLGEDLGSDNVYIVDQVDADTKKYDEHKIILGVKDMESATALYDAGFSDGRGPDRRGAVTEVSLDTFKEWLDTGDTTAPYGEIVTKKDVSRETIPKPEQEAAEEAPEIEEVADFDEFAYFDSVLPTLIEDPQMQKVFRDNKGTPAADVLLLFAKDYQKIGDDVIRRGGTLDEADKAQADFLQSKNKFFLDATRKGITAIFRRADAITGYESFGLSPDEAAAMEAASRGETRPATAIAAPDEVLEREIKPVELQEGDDFSLGQGEMPDKNAINIERVRERVEDLARQMVPDVNVEMVDRLFAEGAPVVTSGGEPGVRMEVAGRYQGAENLITVALNFADPESTIRHEAIHALKRGGFFTDAEWATMEREAVSKWKDAYGVEDTEEAIAYAFGDFRAGGEFLPRFRRPFARIRKFLVRLGNMIRGMGFQTTEDIFGAVEYGEVAERDVDSQIGDRRADPGWLKEQLSLGKVAVRGDAEQEAAITRITGDTHKPIVASVFDWISNIRENKGVIFRQGLVDQYAAWEALEKGENNGELLDASESAYKAMRMTQNLHSVMAAILRHGPLKYVNGGFKIKGGSKGFEVIFEALAKAGLLRLWKGWALANRAQRLKREDREKLMTDAEILSLLKLGKQYPEFQKVMDEWTAFNKDMLDMAEESGLINADQRAVWEHSDYVPFYRILDGDLITGAGRGRAGIEGQRSGIRTLTGGEAQVNDVIENMIMNMSSMTDRAMKNVAARKAVALGLQTGAIETAGHKIRSAMVLAEPTAKQLEELSEELGIDFGMVPKEVRGELIKTLTIVPPSEPDIISVMEDGKPSYYRVLDPMLYNGITSLTPMQLGGVMKMFRMSKRLLTEGVTMDPAFMLANVIRDTMSAGVITGKTSPLGVMSGFAKALREDTSLVSIMAAGGGSGGFYRTDPEDVSKIITTKIRGIDKRTILDSPKKLWEAWHKIGAASEAANRIAIFDAVKKQGGTDAEAAYQALNLLDFSMRGEWKAIRLLIETVPFLNARMQGLYRLGEGFNENRTGFVLRGGIIMGASMALLAANWDDPRYDELEEWDKDTYYHFWIDDQHFRLPKGFEVGAIFSTVPERLMRWATGKDTTREAAVAVLRMFSETFAFNPTPQLLHPVVEQIANRKFFTGSTIVPLSLEKLDPEAQRRPWTSETAEVLGKVTGTSPLRIEHVINGYLGSMGGYLLAISDAAVRMGYDKPPEPELRLDEIPVMKRFVRSDPPRSTKFKTEFYRVKREAEKAYNTIKDYRNRGMVKDAKEYLADNLDRIAVRKGLHRAGLAMSEMNKAIRAIQESRTMSPEEKRRRIDSLLRRQNKLAERMVKAQRQIEKKFSK